MSNECCWTGILKRARLCCRKVLNTSLHVALLSQLRTYSSVYTAPGGWAGIASVNSYGRGCRFGFVIHHDSRAASMLSSVGLRYASAGRATLAFLQMRINCAVQPIGRLLPRTLSHIYGRDKRSKISKSKLKLTFVMKYEMSFFSCKIGFQSSKLMIWMHNFKGSPR